MNVRWLAAWALVGALAAPALADDVALRYEGAEACPDRAVFEAMVTTRLGYVPFDGAAARTAHVRVAPSGATLRIVEGDEVVGERALRGTDCAELARATALALAIAIDPAAVYEVTPEPAVVAEPVVAAAPPAPAPARRPPPRPSPLRGEGVSVDDAPKARVHVAAGVVAAFGASPDPTAGATVQLGIRRGAASLDLEGRADRSSHVEFGDGRVHASLAFAAVVPCYHRAGFAGCGVLAVGALRGRGEDFVDATTVTSTFAAGGARISYEVPLADRLGARLHADVLGAFARTSLQVSGMDVWTLPPVSGAVGVSAVGHFE